MKKNQDKYISLTDGEIATMIVGNENLAVIRTLQELLYLRLSKYVYYKCFSILKQETLAKDLTHDIFIKVFLNLDKYSGKGSFKSWIGAVSYNFCINYIKKQNKSRIEELDVEDKIISTESIELENKILEELKLNQLEKLIYKLGENERIILHMRYQDNMSIKLIAQILELSESATKMRLKRSRDHLASLFKDLTHGK